MGLLQLEEPFVLQSSLLFQAFLIGFIRDDSGLKSPDFILCLLKLFPQFADFTSLFGFCLHALLFFKVGVLHPFGFFLLEFDEFVVETASEGEDFIFHGGFLFFEGVDESALFLEFEFVFVGVHLVDSGLFLNFLNILFKLSNLLF